MRVEELEPFILFDHEIDRILIFRGSRGDRL